MPDLAELIATYKLKAAGMSQRELALLEAEIRKHSPPTEVDNRGTAIDRWMVVQLGGTSYAYRHRWSLIRMEGVEALWERIDNGLPLGTAIRIVREAKQRAGARFKTPSVMRKAIAEELAIHDRLDPGAARPDARVASPAARGTWTNDREFWAFLRRQIVDFADQNLMDVGEMDRSRLVENIERDLDSLVKHHQHRWYEARRDGAKHVKINKRRLSDACHALHMDMPRRGTDLSAFLRKANHQKRTLARAYHPDSNRGDDSLRPSYEAVIQAYATIEQWVSEQQNEDPLPSDRPSLRVVKGGKE
jgi:hypothetical protein